VGRYHARYVKENYPTMQSKQTIDLTRWNRKDRRALKKHSNLNIPGRNLPYNKEVHGILSNYNTQRATELSQEKNNG
jgi:hypothetical protein